ncbi:unnamed protein product [Peniophora sp. CBMAI 1063]|nr:unnamed protein product [Peniophora sp. CBMAI 1063]
MVQFATKPKSSRKKRSVETPAKTSSGKYRTRTAVKAERELWEQLAAKRPSYLWLDKRFRYGSSKPILHFGMTYTKESIMHCALRNDLLPPIYQEEAKDPAEEARRICMAVWEVKLFFEKQLGVEILMPSAFTHGQLGVFSIYSNHTRVKWVKRMGDNHRPIWDFMRQELGVKQFAAWYWDIKYGASYVCKYEEFNL